MGYVGGAMTNGQANQMVRILGVDPGLQRLGWGMIEFDGVTLSYLASGTLTSKTSDPLAVRLAGLFQDLTAVVARWSPCEAAVEQTFVNKDAKATLKLGQARGIALLVPALAGCMVAEYAPNRVKKTVTGAGHADKSQIDAMLKLLLPKAQPDTADAADALAIAICHAHNRTAERVLAAMNG